VKARDMGPSEGRSGFSFSEFGEMLRQTARDYFHTGAIAPSSISLAREITRPIPLKHPPRAILEVGPGTGPFSRLLVEKLLPGDSLTLCEINEEFVKRLERWVASLPQEKQRQIRIARGDILLHSREGGYHHIVCGLPFNNFPPALVEAIFEHFTRLSLPQGTLSFFEYLGARRAKKSLPPAISQNIRSVDRLIRGYVARAQTREHIVWRNLPPARVRHFSCAALHGDPSGLPTNRLEPSSDTDEPASSTPANGAPRLRAGAA